MAAIRNSDIDKLSRKELEAKIAEFERGILEHTGEGRPDKARPLKKGIARIKTRLSQDLNKSNDESSSTNAKKVTEQK
jgi:ribosomal protein L29